jgi:peptide/nickel transport system substrate-binding protein
MGKKSVVARFIHLTLGSCLLITLMLAGCTKEPVEQGVAKQEPSNNPANSEPTYGGTLKFIFIDSITNLGYPAEQRVSSSLHLVQPVLETLGRYDASGKITPWLAESWQSNPQEKTITIKLKQGIKFHDDTDFNAEAVKWNIEEYQKAKRPEVNGIKSIDVIDANTLRLNLTQWDITLLENVAYYVKMVSPAAIQKNGKEWAVKNPVGTGPFTLASWERDVSVKFKKNEKYWQKGKPYLDSIEYALFTDRNTATNVFKTGGADVLHSIAPDDFLEFEKSGKYTTRTTENIFGALGVGLAFDSANPNSPFANVKVRQAAMHAVDTAAIAQSVLRGMAIPTNQWYTPSSPYYNSSVKGYPYDPEKAKQLLAEAGFPNGFKTTITTDPTRANVMTAVQSYLAKVGIDAQIVTVDPAKWSALIADKWDGMILMYRGLTPSSVVQHNRILGKGAALYAKNMIHPDDVEKWLADAKSAVDVESSQKAAVEVQKAIIDEHALYFPLIVLKSGFATQPSVQNLSMWTINASDWNPEDVWKKK